MKISNNLISSLPGLSGQPILFSKRKSDRPREAGDDEVEIGASPPKSALE
jgi:hypothetical protein